MMKLLLTLALSSLSLFVEGNVHTARIVKLENKAEVFVPGAAIAGKHPSVKYLNKVYHVLPATKGMKLEDGFIVTTLNDSKVKVIYNNGDHFFVAPNTQYQVELKKKTITDKDETVMTVMRGAVRGLVEKDGPRSGLKVVTKTAVMGIRGTDFQVKLLPGNVTQVSVLRGRVEVSKPGKSERPVEVETGQVLLKKEQQIQLGQLTKQDLKEVAQESTIKGPTEKEAIDPEVAQLEKKASEVTLKDIKEYQPKIYQEIIKNKQDLSSDSLALNTAEALAKEAPVSRKPEWREMHFPDDPYEKYKFNKEN